MKTGFNLGTWPLLWTIYFAVTLISFVNGKSLASVMFHTSKNHTNTISDGKPPPCKFAKPIIYDKQLETDITSEVTKNRHHPDHLTILLPFDTEELILDLILNKQLMAKGYFRKIQENGITNTDKPSFDKVRLCQYTGTVRSRVNSWVAISVCDGLSGVIYDGSKMLHVERTKNGEDNEHFVYEQKDLSKDNNTCDFTEAKHSDVNKLFKHKRSVPQNSTIIRRPHNANTASRYLELVLVVDYKKYIEMNSNIEDVEQYCKNVANIVHRLYLPLNIFVALVGVVIWTEHDEIQISDNSEATLANFLRYRREKLVVQHPNDNAHLITKQTFRDRVEGKALKKPICTFEYSGGVTSDHSKVVGDVATTVAHLIGHNFGMEHDTETCNCPDERCIMSVKTSSIAPTHWSSCSIESLKQAFAHGMDHCLKNIPTSLFKGPVCGNGFLEDGEECDCGLPEYCSNKCCDAPTCTLKNNATCATGKCCDLKTCILKNPGIVCRRAVTECDLSEYCTGKSEYCPAEVYKIDGAICKDGNGYCYQGMCGTHSDQCKILWGPTGESSNEECYKSNLKGNRHGHCGYHLLNGTYSKCIETDVACGTLQCRHLNDQLQYGLERVAIVSQSFINSKGQILPCSTAIVDLGLDSSDPGMVPNGAKCGANKMCINQKCVSVASVQKGLKCPHNCFNNGFCNNLGHCHCDVGFLLPYCQYLAPGGSIDSGPAYVFSEGVLLL